MHHIEHISNAINSYKDLHSDHIILQLNIWINEPIIEKHKWKFNSSMLHDPNNINAINSIINDCENEYDDVEDTWLTWEITKYKMRYFSTPYWAKKKRERPEIKHVETLQVEWNLTRKL